MTVPYEKLAKTLKKGQLYWIESGIPLTEAEVEAYLKDIEHPAPNTYSYSVPQSLVPAFHAIELRIQAEKAGDHKRAQEIKRSLDQWFAEHPDLHAKFGEEFKRTGFKWTAEKIRRARELAKPLGTVEKLLRYFRGIAEAVLNRREP